MKKIMQQELKLYLALKKMTPVWLTSAQAAEKASIPHRTAKWHLNRFKNQGVLEVIPLRPKPRYRLKKDLKHLDDALTKTTNMKRMRE